MAPIVFEKIYYLYLINSATCLFLFSSGTLVSYQWEIRPSNI